MTAGMKLGLFGINMNTCATDRAQLLAVADAAEAGGWESVWTGEHYVLPDPRVASSPAPPETPFLDPFVALSVVAARTEHLLVGTGVTVVPLHQTLALAKRVASLDQVSAGRFLFGVGVGYLAPEFEALGVPMADRGRRMDEQLAAIRAIWTEDAPEVDGDFVSFRGLRAEPRPYRQPGPPLHVGGYVPSAYRRAVEQGHGWYGFALDPDATRACVGQLAQAQERHARPSELPPLDVSITPHPRVPLDRDTLATYAELGVTRLIVLPPRAATTDPAALLDFVEDLPSTLS
jgi:probable F420-dependent oxidoreductase